jgi:hypothetical protein
MKRIITSIKLKIANRFLFLKRKKERKILIQKVIKKYKLDDIEEQKDIIEKYKLIQTRKRAFGRKAALHIQEKMEFMLHYNLIKLK